MESNNDDQKRELDELRTKMMKENQFLRAMAGKQNGVYFDAYRTKAYDGGGEENLTFQVHIYISFFNLKVNLFEVDVALSFIPERKNYNAYKYLKPNISIKWLRFLNAIF